MASPLQRPMMFPQQKATNVVATTEERALFNYAKREIFKPDGMGQPTKNRKAILSPGFLRLEFPLSLNATATAWSNLQFPVLTNDTVNNLPARTSEQRLDPPNAFLVDRMGFFIGTRPVANAQSTMALETFDSATLGAAATLASIRGIYAGNLSVKCSSTEYIRKHDMLSFRYVGTSQNLVAPSVGDTWEASAFRLDDVLYRYTPGFWLNGGSQNEITVQLKDSLTFTANAVSDLVAVLFFKGILAQNAGEFNPDQTSN